MKKSKKKLLKLEKNVIANFKANMNRGGAYTQDGEHTCYYTCGDTCIRCDSRPGCNTNQESCPPACS